MCLLAITLFCPPYLLLKMEDNFKWGTRYLLSALPAAYTGLGWQLATFAYRAANCQGGVKNINGCFIGNVDITTLVGYGYFLMIPFFFLHYHYHFGFCSIHQQSNWEHGIEELNRKINQSPKACIEGFFTQSALVQKSNLNL